MQNSIVYLNGLFTPLKNANVSILDRGFCYGDGLFETMRACKGKIFKIDQHIERLFQSLPVIFLELPMTREELKIVVQETLNRNKFKNAVIRLTITRGNSSSHFQLDSETPPTLVVHIKPHQPLANSIYKKGAKITLFSMNAIGLPGIEKGLKSCNFLSNILIREMSMRKGCMEGVIVDPTLGVTEGATSNLFIVKQGILKTPKINKYVLGGITRQVILGIAREHKVPVEEGLLTSEDVLNADEAFITNSGIDVVPVIQVDEKFIANKKPGVLTRFLQDELLKDIEECR
jgi:branched-chain amino acid aminotransferase